MRVADVMSTPVLTVRSGDSIERAATLLTSNGITAAPVVDRNGGLVGIVSEGDLLTDRPFRAGADEDRHHAPRKPRKPPAVVADVMSTNAVTMPPDADLAEVAAAMLDNNVRSIPIVDDAGTIAGIVSRRDLLHSLVRSDDTVRMEIQRRLDDYAGGHRRWTVTVVDGHVSIAGPRAGDVEQAIVAVLARTVPGAVSVRFPSPP